jgi:hypothetical protein
MRWPLVRFLLRATLLCTRDHAAYLVVVVVVSLVCLPSADLDLVVVEAVVYSKRNH